MKSFDFLWIIAIILLSTKVLGLISQKVNMPQVVGALLAGLILGPSVMDIVEDTDFLEKIAELGVIILMFSAGLDTDLEELKKTGLASFIIATIGVIVPLVGGAFTYIYFFESNGDPNYILKAVFVGVILTATSVSITVETLREMGKLKGKIGTAILGAAIIDDILGIIVLTVISSFADPSANAVMVFVKIGLFFVFLLIIAIIAYKLFKFMEKMYGQKRRVAIYGFAFCLLMAYISERYFGVADITGAYFAGMILCNITETRDYLERKMSIMAYMIFSPMFFASIGIKTIVSGLTGKLIMFSLVLLIVAVLTKVIGCGIGALVCKFTKHEAFCVGIGMISRGEVALIVAQKGAQAGILSAELFPAAVIVVIVTTLITPVLLNLVMKDRSSKIVSST